MLDPSKSLTLPSHVNFADLEFRVDGTDYLYQPRPFLRFCHHNEIAMTQLSINERGALIQRWYDLHLSAVVLSHGREAMNPSSVWRSAA